jgi:hypothetical protein
MSDSDDWGLGWAGVSERRLKKWSLDLTEADEFSVACQSLSRTDL